MTEKRAIPTCFFCRMPIDDINLSLFKKAEAETKEGEKNKFLEETTGVILSYEPCMSCKTRMKEGITLVGVVDSLGENEEPRPPITLPDGDVYPTGDTVTLNEEMINLIIQDENLRASIIENRGAYMQNELVTKIIELIELKLNQKRDNNEQNTESKPNK